MTPEPAPHHCTRCRSPLEDGDLRCAVCALPAPLPPPRLVGARVSILRCTECHAAVAFAPAVQAPHCAFCGAVMAIEQVVDPIEVADQRVPFVVDREAATRSLRGWLARRGYFAPPQLHREAVFDSLVPIYWAGWVVNARAMVAWTADSDAGSRRSRWAPHAGQLPIEFANIVVPASRGLSETECGLLVPYYDLGRAGPIAQTEVPVEGFESQRSAARRHVHEAIESVAKVRVEPNVPGRRFRNIHVSCLVEQLSTDRVALPAWVLAYRYRDRPYRAIVHGQRPEVVFGDSPVDWAKVARVALAVLLAVAAVAALVWLGSRR